MHLLFPKRRAGLIHIRHETAKLHLGLSPIIDTVHPQFEIGLNEIDADDDVRLGAGAGPDHGRERPVGGFQEDVLQRAADIHDLDMAAIVRIFGLEFEQRWREFQGAVCEGEVPGREAPAFVHPIPEDQEESHGGRHSCRRNHQLNLSR